MKRALIEGIGYLRPEEEDCTRFTLNHWLFSCLPYYTLHEAYNSYQKLVNYLSGYE